ncbi:MAG: hypothetical protein IT422_19420 [Pirellulaceae bacterium]|nr:hypothetical protein [Pirellulaceae bacterium]
MPPMYGCHIMDHQDNRMMGQYSVVKEPNQLNLLNDDPSVVIFIMGLAPDTAESNGGKH